MEITKMHGLGNSQILVPDFDEILENETGIDYSGIARALSHPGIGIGSDQVLIILPSEKADYKMRVFNKDGGEAEMCGNGIRCVARYLYDKGKVGENPIIETLAGKKKLKITTGEKKEIEVNMGKGQVREKNKRVNDFVGSYVSIGNPHFVIFTEKASRELAVEKGPSLEAAEEFQPEKANIEFSRIASKNMIETFVWERGAGLTLACGTGACATAFAARKKEMVNSEVNVKLLGGTLKIRINQKNQILMKGPAEYIFEGNVPDVSGIYSNLKKLEQA